MYKVRGSMFKHNAELTTDHRTTDRGQRSEGGGRRRMMKGAGLLIMEPNIRPTSAHARVSVSCCAALM